jgi:molybdenum cofactor cytidylyltransferase
MQDAALVVLAAGSGSRFIAESEDAGDARAPGHKLAQAFGASTVLGTTLANAVRSQLPLIVVTTDALLAQVTHVVAARDVIVLPDAAANGLGESARLPLGMGFSISVGVSARADARGWLVLPGDMPMVRAATLRSVAAALQQHPVVYAQYRGRRGHPVGFSSELYSELVQLSGEEGARRLVARYPAFGVEVDDAGVLADVDTPQDLDRLRADHAAREELQDS